jgi:hypothetical protein
VIYGAVKDWKEISYRILAIVISSVFFANIPLLLFLIYMGHYGFFSYDFFSEGVFGLKVFFFLTAIFVLIASLAVFWWVIPLVEWWKKKRFKVLPFIGIAIFNLFFTILVIAVFPKNGDLFKLAYVFGIGVFISFHVAFLLHAKPNEQFRTLVAVIFITTFMSLHLREQAAANLANGLKAFGVGGGIDVALVPKAIEENTLKGKLILLSPKHIYIKFEGSVGVSIIDRARFDVITIEHNKKLNKDAAKDAAPVS